MIRTLVGAAIAVAALAPTASAEGRRYALLVGANRGAADDAELRFAESDAEGLADTLRDLGGFAADDVVVEKGGRAEDVKTALARLTARITADADPDAMLVVYYSGHGDSQALHLSRTQLDMAELRALVEASPAAARLLVIDACRSGALTRVKGGRKGPSFAIDLDPGTMAHGTVVVTSSAAGEDAQESDQLRGSFFTFYLRTGLSGSADANGDDAVTLAEAYAYTKDATIAATSRTVVGPQHPTFEIELGGREDLVLSRLRGDRLGTLELPEPGWWLVFSADGKIVVAEVRTDRTRHRLALRGGGYRLVQRRDDDLREGKVTIAAGATTAVAASALRRSDYARVVRRGGSGRRAAWSAFVTGGLRTQLLGFGTAWGGALGARLDLPSVSFEARVLAARSEVRTEDLRGDAWEAAVSITALRVLDAGAFAFALGAEAGGGFFRRHAQTVTDTRLGTEPELSLGVVSQAQLVVGRAYLRLDAAVLGYLVKATDLTGGATEATFHGLLGVRVGLGAGVYF